MSSTFDTVDRFYAKAFQFLILLWVFSTTAMVRILYLSGGSQSTNLAASQTAAFSVDDSVPQGSVRRSLKFISLHALRRWSALSRNAVLIISYLHRRHAVVQQLRTTKWYRCVTSINIITAALKICHLGVHHDGHSLMLASQKWITWFGSHVHRHAEDRLPEPVNRNRLMRHRNSVGWIGAGSCLCWHLAVYTYDLYLTVLTSTSAVVSC